MRSTNYSFAAAYIKSVLQIISVFLGLFAISPVQAGISPVYEMVNVFGPASDTDGNYSLSWQWEYYDPSRTSNTPPTEARIEESLNGGSYVLLATTTGSGTSYGLSNRSSGTYTYRVKVCGSGCSSTAISNPVTVVRTPARPELPATHLPASAAPPV